MVFIVFSRRNNQLAAWKNDSACSEAIDPLQFFHRGEEITSEAVEVVIFLNCIFTVGLAVSEFGIVVSFSYGSRLR